MSGTQTDHATSAAGPPAPPPQWVGLVLVGALAYVASWSGLVPGPRYLQVEGAFTLAPPAGAMAMSLYAHLLWGAAGAAVGYTSGRVLARVLCRPEPARVWSRLALVTLLAASVGIAAYEVLHWTVWGG